MSTSLVQQDKDTAKKKGWIAAGTGAGSVALLVLAHPFLFAAGAVATGYFAWDWFRFRAKRGMRF
jgi:hypothetical protein